MDLIASKPILIDGVVIVDGHPFQTQEQHGRELIKKGYAYLVEPFKTEKEPEKGKNVKKEK